MEEPMATKSDAGARAALDGDRYFDTPARRRTRQRIEERLGAGARLAVLTADAGAGKTVLMRRVLDDGLSRESTCCAFEARDAMRAREVLARLLHALGEADRASGLGVLITRLGIRLAALPGRALLVVDDAQRLPAEALGVLMALSARPRTAPRLTVVLVGRPRLLSRLQSVATTFDDEACIDLFDLPPLTRDEVADYVHLRVHRDGERGDSPFGDGLVDWLTEASRGHPGWVDSLAAHTLHQFDDARRSRRRLRRRRSAAWWLAGTLAASAGGIALASGPSRDGAMDALWRSVEPAPEAREARVFRSSVIPID